jgi:hypothetical protein
MNADVDGQDEHDEVAHEAGRRIKPDQEDKRAAADQHAHETSGIKPECDSA